jgi:hypothetical protein
MYMITLPSYKVYVPWITDMGIGILGEIESTLATSCPYDGSVSQHVDTDGRRLLGSPRRHKLM